MDFMFVDMSKLVEIKVKMPAIIKTRNMATGAFGTQGYMPLEQKIHGIVTERTDIYALGILLFELLCPYKFSSYKFDSPNQIHSFLSKSCIFVPNFISKIIFKATQEKELNRYETVKEVIAEIENNNKWYRRLF